MSYTESEARAFINHIGPIIRAEATARGYKICSTAIAQAIVEGAAGTSKLAKEYHNHFGMKAYAPYKGLTVNMLTKEEKNGVLKNEYADFRAYSDDTEGVKGYYEFLRYNRYAPLKSADTPEEYADLLSATGYATDKQYNTSLIKDYVDRYDLRKYDTETNGAAPAHIQKRRTLKKTKPIMSGSDVIICQKILRSLGYNIGASGVDGKYGPATENAVKMFQDEHGLIVDGKVGIKTWTMLEKYNE